MRQRSLEGFFRSAAVGRAAPCAAPRAAKRAKSSVDRPPSALAKAASEPPRDASPLKSVIGGEDRAAAAFVGETRAPAPAGEVAGAARAAGAALGTAAPDAASAASAASAAPLPPVPDASSELLSLLSSPSWRAALAPEFSKPYFAQLESFLAREWSAHGSAIFPPKPLVFNALNTCPLERVRVVILGQDPYHGPGQAMGLSFSVPRGVPVPSSLRNIHKELYEDINLPRPGHGSLQAWADRGVLLLNAVLTVRSGQPNSHANKGWERFTDAVIRAVAERAVREGDEGPAARPGAAATGTSETGEGGREDGRKGGGDAGEGGDDAKPARGPGEAGARPARDPAPTETGAPPAASGAPPSPHVIFMLWGRYAQKKGEVIRAIARRAPSRILVLEAAHPSGLSASRGFFGCRHFSKANCWLRDRGEGYIDWRYD